MNGLHDYDLYLIHKDLQQKKIRDYSPDIIGLPVDLPESFRVYFVDAAGNIRFALADPQAVEVILLKWFSAEAQAQAGTSVYLIRGKHIADVLIFDEQMTLLTLSALSTRNLLQQAFLPDWIERALTGFREAISQVHSAEFAAALSDEGILDLMYKDNP